MLQKHQQQTGLGGAAQLQTLMGYTSLCWEALDVTTLTQNCI